MSLPYRLALAGATLISSIATYDAIHSGVTGRASGFSDEYGPTPMMVVGGLVHGLAYASFVAVLHAERCRIDGGSGFRSWIRRLLAATFGVLAAMFLVGTWYLPAIKRADLAFLSAIGGIAFLLMFALAFALGLSLVRRPELRAGAATLLALVPAIALAIALQALGSGFGHPAYAEAAVAFGVALLGHRAQQQERRPNRSGSASGQPAKGFSPERGRRELQAASPPPSE